MAYAGFDSGLETFASDPDLVGLGQGGFPFYEALRYEPTGASYYEDIALAQGPARLLDWAVPAGLGALAGGLLAWVLCQ